MSGQLCPDKTAPTVLSWKSCSGNPVPAVLPLHCNPVLAVPSLHSSPGNPVLAVLFWQCGSPVLADVWSL
jgi:hypothetical protein